MEESDDLRNGFAWLVALCKFQEVARHANGIYSSQFEACVTVSKCRKENKEKLVIITSATALMYSTIFANNENEKRK
jgi:hypothetical protein